MATTNADIKYRLFLPRRKKKLNEKIIRWVKQRRLAKEPVKIHHGIEKAKSFHVDLKPYEVCLEMVCVNEELRC